MPCSLISPTIIANYDEAIFKANYCHIGNPFNRYYFMGDPVLDSAKRISVPLKVDVRKTWEADLKKMETLVTRREGKTQIRIPDEKIGALGGCKNYYYAPHEQGRMFEPALGEEEEEGGWSLSWNIVLELIGGTKEEEEEEE